MASHHEGTKPPPPRTAFWAASAAVTLGVATAALAVVSVRGGTGVHEWQIAGFVPGYAVAGYLLARNRPDVPFGWLYLLAGIAAGLGGLGAAYGGAALAHGWPGAPWGIWVTSWTMQLEAVFGAVAVLYFPDGRINSRWWRRVARMPLIVVGASCLLTMVIPGRFVLAHDMSPAVGTLTNPAGVDSLARLGGLQHALNLTPDVVLTAVAVVIGVRFLRAHGLRRRQLRWLALEQVSAPFYFIPIVLLRSPGLLFPAAVAFHLLEDGIVTFTILRWRAVGIDVAVRRSVLAATLLVAALGTYAAIVAAVGAAVGTTGPVVSAIGATVAVFSFAPLSGIIRTRVNSLFYGRRDDPYALVAALGQRLSDASDPDEGVRRLVDTLTDELRLPFVDLTSSSGNLLAARGALESGDEPLSLTLNHQGVRVGTLRVGHRRGESAMTDAEQVLLSEIARQVGAAVHAVVLVHDLRHARERLVLAREEERRRLQRDLHDGLGPQLTAVTLKMDAARNRVHQDPDGAVALLAETSDEARQAVRDVRRLVYALGDPSLDSLGLVAALQGWAERLGRSTDGLIVAVSAAEPFAQLPAAVEVAAFRIVCEAINNALRHGHARSCHVSLDTNGALHLLVDDDGGGLPQGWAPGVGISSMHERAAELGGTCHIGPAEPTGTCIAVMLPLPEAQ